MTFVQFHPEACREPKEAHVIEAVARIRHAKERRAGIHSEGDSPDLPVGVAYPYRARVLNPDGTVALDAAGVPLARPGATPEDIQWDRTVAPLNDSRDFALAMNAKSKVMNQTRNDSRIACHLDLLFNPECHLGSHLDPLEAHVILRDSIELAAEMARMFVADRKRKGEERAALIADLADLFAEPETYADFQLLTLDLLKTYPKDIVLAAIEANVKSTALPPAPARKAPAAVAPTTPPPSPPPAPAAPAQ